MEGLVKRRSVVRSITTKTVREAEASLDRDELEELAAKIVTLRGKGTELRDLDQRIGALKLETCTEEELVLEEEKTVEYQEEITRIVTKAESKLQDQSSASDKASQHSSSGSGVQTPQHSSSCSGVQMGLKLPKLELRTFNGELADWLGFWAQFEKIDGSDIDLSDKFQYLLQACKGKAKEIVGGFPPTRENYPKAITALKARFGNVSVLGEMYTRELLSLCLNNNQSGKQYIQIVYDKIVTALRALESLDINIQNCAPILTPMVESTLPEDTLRTFRRSLSGKKRETSSKERLDQLLQFLQEEIETEHVEF